MKNLMMNKIPAVIFTVLLSIFTATNLRSQQPSLSGKIMDNDINSVKEMIAAGADINKKDSNGYTSLMTACHYNRLEIAKLLVSAGAELNVQEKSYGYTPLILACQYKYHDLAKYLISKGADINIQGKEGATALMAAASNSREIVELLLSKGADVNARMTDGTGVFAQCITGIYWDSVPIELAETLLAKGADVDEAATTGSSEGFTPLMLAATNNLEDLARFLIKNGANVNATAKDGKTPLSIATKEGYNNIVEILKANGAK